MDCILTALWTALEAIAFVYLCRFFSPTAKLKKRSAYGLILIWALSQLYLNLNIAAPLKSGISVLYYIIASIILQDISWYQHIFVSFIWFSLSGLIDTLFLYGVSLILHISVNDLIWKKRLYITIITLGKLFTIFLTWMLMRLGKCKYALPSQKRFLLLSLITPCISGICLYAVFISSQTAPDISMPVVLFCGFLALVNIGVAYFSSEMEKTARQETELIMLNQQIEIQSSNIQALEKGYRTQRSIIHEHRSQLQTILGLLLQNDSETAYQYINNLLGQQTKRIFPINTHHSLIDALLNQKYQIAREKGIDFHFEVNDLSSLQLDPNKIIVLLSNLIDNAIEGCCRYTTTQTIACRIILEPDILQISIKNTSPPIRISGKTIPTSKVPASEHGFGIPQILYIIESFHGTSVFDYSDGWFIFAIEIPTNN